MILKFITKIFRICSHVRLSIAVKCSIVFMEIISFICDFHQIRTRILNFRIYLPMVSQYFHYEQLEATTHGCVKYFLLFISCFWNVCKTRTITKPPALPHWLIFKSQLILLCMLLAIIAVVNSTLASQTIELHSEFVVAIRVKTFFFRMEKVFFHFSSIHEEVQFVFALASDLSKKLFNYFLHFHSSVVFGFWFAMNRFACAVVVLLAFIEVSMSVGKMVSKESFKARWFEESNNELMLQIAASSDSWQNWANDAQHHVCNTIESWVLSDTFSITRQLVQCGNVFLFFIRFHKSYNG